MKRSSVGRVIRKGELLNDSMAKPVSEFRVISRDSDMEEGGLGAGNDAWADSFLDGAWAEGPGSAPKVSDFG